MANTGSHVYLWPEQKGLSMQTGLEVWVVCLQVLGEFSLERVFGSKVFARKPHQDQRYLYLTRPFWIWKKLAFDSTKQRGSSQKRGTQVRYFRQRFLGPYWHTGPMLSPNLGFNCLVQLLMLAMCMYTKYSSVFFSQAWIHCGQIVGINATINPSQIGFTTS